MNLKIWIYNTLLFLFISQSLCGQILSVSKEVPVSKDGFKQAKSRLDSISKNTNYKVYFALDVFAIRGRQVSIDTNKQIPLEQAGSLQKWVDAMATVTDNTQKDTDELAGKVKPKINDFVSKQTDKDKIITVIHTIGYYISGRDMEKRNHKLKTDFIFGKDIPETIQSKIRGFVPTTSLNFNDTTLSTNDRWMSEWTSAAETALSSGSGSFMALYPFYLPTLVVNEGGDTVRVYTEKSVPAEFKGEIKSKLASITYADTAKVLFFASGQSFSYKEGIVPQQYLLYKQDKDKPLRAVVAKSYTWKINDTIVSPVQNGWLNELRVYKQMYRNGINTIAVEISYDEKGVNRSGKLNTTFDYSDQDMGLLTVKMYRRNLPVKTYKDYDKAGDKEKDESLIKINEIVEFELYEKQGNQEVKIENAIWKVDNKIAKSTRLKHTFVNDTTTLYVQKTDKDRRVFFLTFGIEGTDASEGTDLAKALDLSALGRRDTANAKKIYRKSLNAIKANLTDAPVYNYYNGKNIAFSVHIVPVSHPEIKNNTPSGSVLGGFANANVAKILGGKPYSFLDLKNITYENLGNKVIQNATMVQFLTDEEKKAFRNASRSKTESDVTVITLQKIRRLHMALADTLKQKIMKGDTVFFKSQLLDTLYFQVTDTEVSQYINPVSGEKNIYLNYNYLNGSQQDCNQTVAHELIHVFFKIHNSYNCLLWMLIQDKVSKYGYKVADNKDGLPNNRCSAGSGHERHNPENKATCDTQTRY
jgi:hypothetical protein